MRGQTSSAGLQASNVVQERSSGFTPLTIRVALGHWLHWLRASRGDVVFRGIVSLCALSSVAIVVGLVVVLLEQSSLSIRTFGLAFLVTDVWDPVKQVFGIRNFILGTLLVGILALAVAGVTGVLVAVYLSEFAPRPVREPLMFLIELLAFIPSVVYGLVGLLVLTPWLSLSGEPWLGKHFGFLPFLFRGPSFGVGILAAITVLAVMLLPIIVALTREALIAVPNDQREALFALGATRWEVVREAVIPYARPGVVGAMILALGRALGETIAVAMTIGGSYRLPTSLFDQGYTIASVIANEFTEVSSQLYLSALIEAGLVLFVLTATMNVLSQYSVRTWVKRRGTGPSI